MTETFSDFNMQSTTENPGLSTADDEIVRQVDAIVLEVLDRRCAGEAVTAEQVMAAHPSLAEELRTRFDEIDRLQQRVGARRDNPAPPAERAAAIDDMANEDLDAPLAADDPRTFPTIAGYSIDSIIGTGGQSVVYSAMQMTTGQAVAIKFLRFDPFVGEQEVARFEREVGILAKLQHPNIVCIIDRGQTADGSRYLIMKRVYGLPLDKWMDLNYPTITHRLDAQRALLQMFRKVVDATAGAHAGGVVHRDLKPTNIVVGGTGEPFLLDFGLARDLLAEQRNQAAPTLANGFIGSYAWASPEQLTAGSAAVDVRSDVYTLGLILYNILTGQFPYDVGGSLSDLLRNVVSVPPTPPGRIMSEHSAKRSVFRFAVPSASGSLNPDLDAIVLKALSKRPEDRYQTAEAFAEDIDNYIAGRRVNAAAATHTRHRRRLAAVVGIIAIMLTTGAILPRSPVMDDVTPAPQAKQIADLLADHPDPPLGPVQIPPTARKFNGHSYAIIDGLWTFDEARKQARALGGNILVIDSRAEHLFITEWLGLGRKDGIKRSTWWLGIMSDGMSHRTLAGDELTYSALPTMLDLPLGHYGGSMRQYSWSLFSAVSYLSLIVEWDSISSEVPSSAAGLPEGAYVSDAHAYLWVEQPTTWRDAEEHCLAMGGTLFMPQSVEQEQLLIDKVIPRQATTSGVWIGIRRIDDLLITNSGEVNPPYTNWAASTHVLPVNTQILLKADGWHVATQGPNEKRPFICQWRIK